MIRFRREVCGDLGESLRREWLETNGLGGYASSTISGLNTRRYHGLLVASTKPPLGRIVLLSKLEETLVIDGRRYELSANQYPGVVHPRGYEYQTGFRLDPFPIFTYEVEGIIVEKSVLMPHGENTTIIRYEFLQSDENNLRRPLSATGCSFHLRPLAAFRDYHSLGHQNDKLNPHVEAESGRATIQLYDELPALNFTYDRAEPDVASFWYRDFEYREERERGFDYREDLFSPFALKFDLSDGRSRLSVIASTEHRDLGLADQYRQAEVWRRREVTLTVPTPDELTRALVAAADQFIVARGEGKTVIAGYPWFSDWGRDTMIALPGLTLATNRPEIAQSVLLEYARYVDRGMLPNRFPDAGEQPEYNTVDATLWFFEAVRALVQHTGDDEFVRANLYEVLADIIDWHVRGTRYNIHVDRQGLLYSGEEGAQLTWMDAKVGDWVVTPRRGLAVEIQALWYNALCVMEELARRFEDQERQRQYARMMERARESFNQLFWNEDERCLYDVIDGDERDGAVRPNQIFAVSLKHTMVRAERSERIVRKVERDLLTPYGLRTLAPTDPKYRGRYEGDSLSRDGAYHQGTVWAWLMGPFITAYLKVNNRSAESVERAAGWLGNFQEHLNEAGLGQISEIFDGDWPHAPRGCIAQAWSVAALLHAAVEDVFMNKSA
ncbi:MAG TPA: amylo-alpha-1,6-glucosidase [Pyrinomonadaceae bacterium]|nr:amylo-alpha-1,6-glucosidase [Pyrinomonadaceae bacterium]